MAAACLGGTEPHDPDCPTIGPSQTSEGRRLRLTRILDVPPVTALAPHQGAALPLHHHHHHHVVDDLGHHCNLHLSPRTSMPPMRFLTLAVLILASCAILAPLAFRFPAAFASFAAYQQASGNREATGVYRACIDNSNSGVIESTEVECAGRLFAYLTRAFSAVAVGSYGLAVVHSNPSWWQSKVNMTVQSATTRNNADAAVGVVATALIVFSFMRYTAGEPTWLARAFMQVMLRLR